MGEWAAGGTAGAADPALLLHFCAISIMYYSRPRCAISAAVCVLYDDMGGELAVLGNILTWMARGGHNRGQARSICNHVGEAWIDIFSHRILS